MADKLNFTKVALDAIAAPKTVSKIWVHDQQQHGLSLCVTKGGAKTFYLYRRVDGKPVQIRIGPYPDLPIPQARRKAAEWNGQVAIGENPAEKQRQLKDDPTFSELFQWYMEHYAKPRKITWDEDEARFRNHLTGLAARKVSKITKSDIRDLHSRVGQGYGIYAANRLLALVRVVFNKGIAYEVIRCGNPAVGIEAFNEQSRDRRLSLSEMSTFLQAVLDEPNDSIRDYVLLSLLTGARRDNVLALRWDQIDWGARTWRIPQTKNGTSQVIPLDDFEVELLRERQTRVSSEWVFPSTGKSGRMVEPRKGWERILARAGIADLRLHDLRRTLGSLMVDTGASLAVIGKTLNHKSQQTTAIYARVAMDPVREAKDKALSPVIDMLRTMEGHRQL